MDIDTELLLCYEVFLPIRSTGQASVLEVVDLNSRPAPTEMT